MSYFYFDQHKDGRLVAILFNLMLKHMS